MKPLPLALAVPLAACATTTPPAPLPEPQERFWQALASYCGNAYEGALASEDARDTDWRGRAMVAHWAECSDTASRSPSTSSNRTAPAGTARAPGW